MEKCKYNSKNEIKIYKSEFQNALKGAQSEFKKSLGFGGVFSIVGSAKRNLVVQRGNSPYDVDYQFWIDSEKIDNFSAEDIKRKMQKCLKNSLGKSWNVNLSTSVITVQKIKNKQVEKSFDLAIIRTNRNPFQIIKGKRNGTFIWNEMPGINEKQNKLLGTLSGSRDWKIMREIFLEKKCSQIACDKDSDNYIPSYALLYEAVKEAKEKKKTRI